MNVIEMLWKKDIFMNFIYENICDPSFLSMNGNYEKKLWGYQYTF